jgi:predicted permease
VPAILRQAWQSWTRARATAALAILAFAVGIGSATAIYTVVNAVLLASVPYADGERWAELYGADLNNPNSHSAHALVDILEYERRATGFDAFGFFRLNELTLTAPGEPRHVNVLQVTPGLVRSLGVTPAIGGWFTDAGGAVISSTLWRQLGEAQSLVGQGMTLDGRRLTITGVMPPHFKLPLAAPGTESFNTDIWIALDPLDPALPRDQGILFAYTRRKPGVTLDQANQEVRRIAADIAAQAPDTHPAYTARLEDLRATSTKQIRPMLLLLFAAAGLLLLVACANVAALLLARSVARSRETAMRVALGARQRQLALHYFVESLPISLAGAAAGFAFSVVLVRVVLAVAAQFIPRAEEIVIDWRVLAFAVAMGVLTSALCSLAPLWQALRMSPNDVLNAGIRASAGARVRRLSQALVVAEIALAFTLLAASTVLIAHIRALMRVPPGFNPNGLITFDLTMPEALAREEDVRVPFQKRLLDAIEAIPGVDSAGFVNQLPLDGCCLGGRVLPDGRPLESNVEERTAFVIATPGFVRTMQIPLISGRLLDDRDADEKLLRVLVNQAAAVRYWPGRNPVEAMGRLNTPAGPQFVVLGVVGNVRADGLARPPVPEVYFIHAITTVNPMVFLVRSRLPPETLAPEVQRAVRSVDATLAVHNLRPMAGVVHDSLSIERVGSIVMTFFAATALLMATLGVYGVMAYGVRQRTTEIGTRMALGATTRDVVALVLGGGLKMAAAGVAAGAVAVMAAAGTLERYFGATDLGVMPFVWSTAVVALVAAAASSLPAWRATFLSPTTAIRDDVPSSWQSARRRMRRTLQELKQAVAAPVETAVVTEGALVTEFVSAARRADSFPEAIRLALATLCEALGARSAMLLEKAPAHEYRSTASSSDGPPLLIPAGGFLLNRLRSSEFPLSLTDGDLEALRQWAVESRPGRVPELDALKAAGVRLALPLRTKQEVFGVLVLTQPAGRDDYDRAEREVLRACAGPFALMVENARLTGRVVEQEKLRRDLALAAEVQKRLLPEQAPPAATAVLTGLSLPARKVGGDYYDFFELGDGRIGIALADVAGKGVPAALIMSVVQASLRVITTDASVTLADLAARLNRFVHRSTGSNSYATFFYMQYEERTRQLRYVNAGHNPPFLLRPDGGIQELPAGGTVIGMFPETSYQDAAVSLGSGDVLLAFTDGVVEAHNAAEEEFGEERLKALLRRVGGQTVPEISAAVLAELKGWIRDTDQYDDLTFVVLKVN